MESLYYTLLLLVSLQVVLYFSEGMPSAQRLILPLSCSEKGYCFEKIAAYPQELVDQLLQSKNMTLTVESDKKIVMKQEAKELMGDYYDESDCEKDTRDDLIYEIVDENDNVRVVVQSEQFRQTILVEECLHPGRITRATQHFTQYVIDEYNIHCVEEKLELSLFALNMNCTGFELVKSKYGFPVACNCRYIETN